MTEVHMIHFQIRWFLSWNAKSIPKKYMNVLVIIVQGEGQNLMGAYIYIGSHEENASQPVKMYD